jgi:hypothetical protein
VNRRFAKGATGEGEGGEEESLNDPETDQRNPSSQPDWLTDDFYKNQIQPKLSNVACASVRQNAPEHDRPTRT